MQPTEERLTVGPESGRREIALLRRAGTAPAILFLGGFMSDMRGSKAEALDAFAAASGRAMLRFDYSGHGKSSGRFEDGTISRWLEEAVAVLQTLGGSPVVLVGSSMGGWIATLLALAERKAGRDRVKGLVLIAPAIDMTHDLMLARMDEATRRALDEAGEWRQPSAYSETPYVITKALIEDGERHLIGGALVEIGAPVHILQGMLDEDVPAAHTLAFVSQLAHDDVVLTLVKDGDHRLSRPEDLERIVAAVRSIA